MQRPSDIENNAERLRATLQDLYLVRPTHDGLRAISTVFSRPASSRATPPGRIPERDTKLGTRRTIHHFPFESTTAASSAQSPSLPHITLPKSRVPVATAGAAQPFRTSGTELLPAVRCRSSAKYAFSIWHLTHPGCRNGNGSGIGPTVLSIATDVDGGQPRARVASNGRYRGKERKNPQVTAASPEPNATSAVSGSPEPTNVSSSHRSSRQQPTHAERANGNDEPSTASKLRSSADAPTAPTTTAASTFARDRCERCRRSSAVRECEAVSSHTQEACCTATTGRSAPSNVQRSETIPA